MERFYDARVSNSTFDDETVKAINDWVNEQTEGKIERILEGFKATDAMVLINAIYFYGDWMKSFDPDDTSKEDFHRRDGSTVSVEMMQKTDTKFPYFRGTLNGSEVQAVRLPYGETGRLGMYVILPRSIPRLVERFDHQMLTTLQENVSATEIDLHMPKYKADFEIQLDEVMRNELGMQNIFEDRPGD